MTSSTALRSFAAVVLATTVVGCGSGPADPAGTPPTATPAGTGTPAGSSPAATGPVRVTDTVATGLRAPWGLAFLPDGGALVSERDTGRIVRVGRDGNVSPIGSVPGVDSDGEGGLLGLALSPDFASDRLVYAYYTASGDNRVVRMRYDEGRPAGEQLTPPTPVLTGIRKDNLHNGGRIAFGPDGLLYISTGDAREPRLAQDAGSLNGKILRVTRDGEPAPGNPEDTPVYSVGHRNVQGLAWDADGQLWASEFGARSYDELNLIRSGGNYGWPEVEGPGGDEGFVEPVTTFSPSEASPSGLAIWNGAAWLASLRGTRLWQVPLTDEGAGPKQDRLTGEYGRLRTAAVAPDGSLWVITSNTDGRGDPREGDDRILRLTMG